MRYLLDSHILIWAIAGSDKLPYYVYQIINDPENEIFYSAASIWEVTIKHQKSPSKIPISGVELADYCRRAGIFALPITTEHALTVDSLIRAQGSAPHNDPFDRIMIAQAKYEQMYFLTHDSLLSGYNEKCVITV